MARLIGPADCNDQAAKQRQKDIEARWIKKHGRSHFGYKNHISMDHRHKLDRIESQSLSGTGIIKIYFAQGAGIGGAMAQINAVNNQVLRVMPPARPST